MEEYDISQCILLDSKFRLAWLPLLILTNINIYAKSISSFIYYFSFREAKKNVEALANSSGNRQTCSMQAADPVELETKSTIDDHPFPEPRLPYPFTSSLTEKEQKTYLYLMTKYSKKINHFQVNAASQRELLTYLVSVHVCTYEHHRGSCTIFLLWRVKENVAKKF